MGATDGGPCQHHGGFHAGLVVQAERFCQSALAAAGYPIIPTHGRRNSDMFHVLWRAVEITACSHVCRITTQAIYNGCPRPDKLCQAYTGQVGGIRNNQGAWNCNRSCSTKCTGGMNDYRLA